MIHVDDAKIGEVTAPGGIHGSGFGGTTQGCGQEPGSTARTPCVVSARVAAW